MFSSNNNILVLSLIFMPVIYSNITLYKNDNKKASCFNYLINNALISFNKTVGLCLNSALLFFCNANISQLTQETKILKDKSRGSQKDLDINSSR